jgi:hypothetical protein
VGVLFEHVGIDFVAKGIVMLKGGKRVHRAGITASAVPRAEGLTTEDTEGTERIFCGNLSMGLRQAEPSSPTQHDGASKAAAPSARYLVAGGFETKKEAPFAGSPFGF